ncbi:MFS transporter [Streptomyces sp. NPDC049916]|uniref:MFS transporter n=1 Tax=Streptomyces sp. NPDC049916 TaxID=3155156 RepID=UPI00343CC084
MGAAVASLVAGLGWILSLTTVNVGMQLILPAWVRAPGLSVYLLVFMGSQAVGSFLWGSVSGFLGVRAALVLPAVLLVGAAASVLVLPMPTTIGRLDRGVVPMSADGPVLLLEEGASDDQPVLVHVVYTVPEENRDAFLRAMDPVRRARRRTGAVRWSLVEEREAAERCRFVEEFRVGSWAEHQRQHEERWTGSDASLLEEARDLAEGTPEVRHCLVRSEG